MYLRESKQRRADGSTVSYLQLAENVWALRSLPLPVIGRIADDRLLLDLRCLEEPDPFVQQLSLLTAALR